MFEVICHDCELDVLPVEEGLAVLRVEDESLVFSVPLTGPMIALLIEQLSTLLLAAAA